MGKRTKVSKRRREDLDEVDLATFATNWPRVKRNCTTGPKNYIDLCSESEDDEKQEDNIPSGGAMTYIRATGNEKRKYDYNGGDAAIDEGRSTPAPGPQAPAVPKSKHETKSNHRILRLTLSQYMQQKLRAGCLFKELPLEIHQFVVAYLPMDRDVASYAQVCRIAADAVSGFVWRVRYARYFDLPEGLNTDQIAKDYKILRSISKKWTCFDETLLRRILPLPIQVTQEQRFNRPLCLSMLKSLIIGSNARKDQDEYGNELIIGLNHNYIRKLVIRDEWDPAQDNVQFIDILNAILNTDETVSPKRILSAEDEFLMQIIQLSLTSLILEPNNLNKVHHFDWLQEMVYGGPYNKSLFKGTWMCQVDSRLCLATVNFFNFHFKNSGEGLLAEEYLDLEAAQLPQLWMGRLKDETQLLGTHWKGAYTYLDEHDLSRFRSRFTRRGLYQTIYIDNFDPLQDIAMFFDESKFPSNAWPESFEKHHTTWPYHSSVFPTRPLRYNRGAEVELKQYPLKSFFGTSRGERDAHFYGRIHAVPPQGGIPGFQRITFLKFFLVGGEYDTGSVWAYEGCVLPGNRVIVGRWWWITDEDIGVKDIASGPFILWNVDESYADPPIDKEESIEFLRKLRDVGVGV